MLPQQNAPPVAVPRGGRIKSDRCLERCPEGIPDRPIPVPRNEAGAVDPEMLSRGKVNVELREVVKPILFGDFDRLPIDLAFVKGGDVRDRIEMAGTDAEGGPTTLAARDLVDQGVLVEGDIVSRLRRDCGGDEQSRGSGERAIEHDNFLAMC